MLGIVIHHRRRRCRRRVTKKGLSIEMTYPTSLLIARDVPVYVDSVTLVKF